MCNFFSFVTEPEKHGGKRFYFNWDYRKSHLNDDNNDSHSSICKHYGLDEDVCNKYEFNPLTKKFEIDQINSQVDDRIQAEDWVNKVNFKRIVEPLIVKPIVNPFDLPKVEKVTDEHIALLKQWASIRGSVWDSVWDAVGASVWASVRTLVRISVMTSIRASAWASVWGAVWAYSSSFFTIKYKYDFSPCVRLWEQGLVPSNNGTITTWRLHSGKNADVVFEWVRDGE
jgi:hypothetical protein